MRDNQTREATLCGLSLPDECFDTLREQLPETHKLFQALDAGVTPNFLDMIGVLSEMSAFITDPDQFDEASELLKKKMSVKFCLFCS